MSDKNAPRGHAAWLAEKERVSERNEAAYARARETRAANDEARAQARRDAERRDFANTPKQPGRG